MIDEAIRAAVTAAIAPMVDELRALRGEVQALRSTAAPQMLSVQQAAGRLGISTCTCRRHIADGSIPSRRVGRRIVVPADALRPTDPTEIARLARLARETQMSSAGVAGGSPSVVGNTSTGRRGQSGPKGTP